MEIKHSIRDALDEFGWYPPAEASIPIKTLFAATLSKNNNLRKTLCELLNTHNCALASNARTLLYLLLKTLHNHDSNKRNEVLIPGYTCYSVAASIAKAGLKIKAYDIDPVTLHPDIESLKNSITNRTLAIISQHLFGIPTPIVEINNIAKKSHIYHIEDAAQALGASADNHLLGTTGDFGLFSFGRGKALPVGGGGALVSKHKSILQEIIFNQQKIGLSDFISTIITQISIKPLLYWVPEKLPLGLGKTYFDTNFNVSTMTKLSQKLAMRLIPSLNDINTHRRCIAKVYDESLDNNLFTLVSKSYPIYTRYPLLATPGQIPQELRRLGVRRMYPQAIIDVKAIHPFLADSQLNTPNSRKIALSLITLPTHKGIHQKLARKIALKVENILKPQ